MRPVDQSRAIFQSACDGNLGDSPAVVVFSFLVMEDPVVVVAGRFQDVSFILGL
jgi:hypothetical protein